MPDARGNTVTVRIAATHRRRRRHRVDGVGPHDHLPRLAGRLRVQRRGRRRGVGRRHRQAPHPRARARRCPNPLVDADGHTTQPPARYTEATLVKTLEEKGIGRPSTYASIMQTIQDRGYVWKKGQALVPTTDAFAVVSLLEQHFSHLVDYEFTARMEDDLDEIAGGRQQRVPWLHQFWFGNGTPGVKGAEGQGPRGGRRRGDQHDPARRRRQRRADRRAQRPLRALPQAGRGHGVGARGPAARRAHHRPGRRDPVGAQGRRTARRGSGHGPAGVRQERPLRPLRAARRRRHAAARTRSRRCRRCSRRCRCRRSPWTRPSRCCSSRARSAPTPSDGGEIIAANGRYGPFLKWGEETRSVDTEEQLLTVTVDDAVKVLAEPKKFGRRKAAPAPPLKELGNDPVSEKPIVVKDGRFGPTSPTARRTPACARATRVENITIERAAELLQIRRDAGPAKKARKGAKKAPAKKAAKKAAEEGGRRRPRRRRPPSRRRPAGGVLIAGARAPDP